MKKVPWWNIGFGAPERAGLLDAFDARAFTQGRRTEALESELARALEVPHVVCTNSGTSALMMALLASGVKAGDEVIVPAISWIATAQPAAMLGARVVVADVLPGSPVMDVQDAIKKTTDKTRAILPVHMNGREVDLRALRAASRDVVIIEDACKATFSRGSDGFLGTQGDWGCFSMGMISLVPTCFGGFVACKTLEQRDRLRLIRWHGVRQSPEEEYATLGSNFKYSDLFAAMGLAQLKTVKAKIERLVAVYHRYQEGLRGLDWIEMVPVDFASGKVPLLVDVRSKHREAISAYLAGHGVETCNFHPPLNEAKYLGYSANLPNGARFARESFHLPCGPDQPLENVDLCIELLKKFSPGKDGK